MSCVNFACFSIYLGLRVLILSTFSLSLFNLVFVFEIVHFPCRFIGLIH